MITPPDGQFAFPPLDRILFGPGKIHALGPELERRGRQRAVVVTGRTLGRSRLLDEVTQSLGVLCAGVFNEAAPHQPSGTIRRLVEQARALGADVLVSFGGGSAIDTAKVAAASLIHGRDMISDAGALDFSLDVAFDPAAPEAGALRCADAVAAFVAGFDVPTSLRAAGVQRGARHDVAAAVCEELAVFPVLERPVTLAEIRSLLDAAYE